MNKVLVVAAHSDDEVLGAGGTIAKHVDNGDTVGVVYLTDGISSRLDQGSDHIDERLTASEQAIQILGASILGQLNLPDNQIDSISRLSATQSIEPIIDEFTPDIVYTHHGGDLNIDHRRALESVLTSLRPQPGYTAKGIYSFEVASSTAWSGTSSVSAFSPNHYVDISEQLERKLEALRAYHEEMRAFPHARSVEALEHLARYRGSQIGVPAAEAFVVERVIA